MQNFIKFHLLIHKILSRKEILAITKGHSSVIHFQKMMHKNSNLDLVKVDAYGKFHQFISEITNNLKTEYPGV